MRRSHRVARVRMTRTHSDSWPSAGGQCPLNYVSRRQLQLSSALPIEMIMWIITKFSTVHRSSLMPIRARAAGCPALPQPWNCALATDMGPSQAASCQRSSDRRRHAAIHQNARFLPRSGPAIPRWPDGERMERRVPNCSRLRCARRFRSPACHRSCQRRPVRRPRHAPNGARPFPSHACAPRPCAPESRRFAPRWGPRIAG